MGMGRMVDSLGCIPDFLKNIGLKYPREKTEVKKNKQTRLQVR